MLAFIHACVGHAGCPFPPQANTFAAADAAAAATVRPVAVAVGSAGASAVWAEFAAGLGAGVAAEAGATLAEAAATTALAAGAEEDPGAESVVEREQPGRHANRNMA